MPSTPKYEVKMSSRQLLEVALWLERTGVEFYRFLSEELEDSRLRNFFLRLAGMEISHENLVREMLQLEPEDDATKTAFDETLTGREFFTRLRGMIEEKVFPLGINFITELDKFRSPREALPAAVQAEEQSIRIYRLLRGFELDKTSSETLNRLLLEEEKHLNEVYKIYNSLK